MEKYSLLLLVLSLCGFAAAQRLQRYNVDPRSLTVSGLSAGGAMASQFHFAHSSEVFGAGIFAGLPYLCGNGGLLAATRCMSTPNLVNVNNLITQANSLANSGSIDATSHIRGDRVYIFHGSRDTTVLPGAGTHVQTMYTHFGAQITSEFSIPASHGFPTHNFGAACGSSSANTAWLNNCGYRGAFEMLNFLYGGGLNLPADNAGILNNLLVFDQSEFFAFNPSLSSMATEGFVYVPTACQHGAQCRLHIAFHGCLQSRANVGNSFAANAGYMEAAEVNNIIVLFPQISAILANPNACFDWWGYLNSFFPTRQGNQVLATYRMVTRLIRG